MKNIMAFAAVLLMVCSLAFPAVVAQNADPGNHYSGIELWQENTNKYGLPPLEQSEINSRTGGSLYISFRSGGCWDDAGRQIVIASMDGKTVLHETMDVDGSYDIRLPPGDYFILIPVGTGSDTRQDSTWKQETADVTIKAGYSTYVSFIGAGVSCGGEPKVCKEVLVEKAYTEHLGNHDVTFRDVGHDHGDYNLVGGHYVYIGHNKGHYDVHDVDHHVGDYNEVVHRGHDGYTEYVYVAPVEHPAGYETQCT